MRLPCLLQVRILKLAVKSLLSRPFTTRFPAEPFEPIAEFRGRPRYDEAECIGCGACAEVCPAACIDVHDDTETSPPRRKLVQHLDNCICCGQCERYCPTEKGIRLTNEYAFIGFGPADFEETVEKELLLCESCGCVIAPKDQIRWVAKRLGPLAFTNPTLMLALYDRLNVVDEDVKPADHTTLRTQRVSMQCPRCRRETVFVV
jgi:formate hydrogenlyase subunit 6/NADH:ubiquinone oxidoreductase subunit I